MVIPNVCKEDNEHNRGRHPNNKQWRSGRIDCCRNPHDRRPVPAWTGERHLQVADWLVLSPYNWL